MRVKQRLIITDSVEMLPLQIVIEAYEMFMVGSNANSFRAKFKYDLPCFLAFLQTKFAAPCLETLTRGIIEEFIDERLSVEAPATVARRFASVQAFCRYCAAHHETFKDPCFRWSCPIVIDRAEPPAIGKDMLDKVIAATEHFKESPYVYHRARVIVFLCAHAGLRCEEARLLSFGDVKDTWLRNIKGKGRHYRKVPQTKELNQAIQEFLPLREALLKKNYRLYANLSQTAKDAYPLIVRQRKPKKQYPLHYAVDHKTIWRIVNDLGKLAGCPTLHPHALRHEFAHELLDKTKNIAVVAKALGHRSIVTTMIYTDQTDSELMKAMA
jgi:site-specific recombinase XerD